MTSTRIDLDHLIESWPRSRPPMSLHLRCALAYAHLSPRKPEPGDPVPGCPCSGCTGITDATPMRSARTIASIGSAEWTDRVDRARAISILEVAKRLSVELRQRGASWLGRSPFREDRNPSLSVSPAKNLWYDFGAGESGDGIKLWMLTRRVDFATAVRDLTY